MLNLSKIRKDTPATENLIHFNNAGASLQPLPVFEAVQEYLNYEFYHGGYETAARFEKQLQSTYQTLAQLIGAVYPSEIALVESATVAWEMAFYAVPLQKGDKILTSRAEYGSNYMSYLQAKQRLGVEILVIPDDEHGQTSPEKLKTMLDEKVKLISITHVPSNGGLINPAEEIGKIAKENNILYLLDACQSVGQLAVDVQKIGCDMMAVTGRKYLRAPRGTGFLYVKAESLPKLKPLFVNVRNALWTSENQFEWREGGQRFENFEGHFAGRIGLGVAAAYALEIGLETIEERVKKLAKYLRESLQKIKGVQVQDLGVHQSGIVTFTHDFQEAETIKQYLHTHNINLAVALPPSALLDMQARKLQKLLRPSVHYYNTEEEIEIFCEVLAKL